VDIGSFSGQAESFDLSEKFFFHALTRFFLSDSRNRIGEAGLGGKRHGRNGGDVDEMRVLADRRLELHRDNRFAGHPRATAIGKEHPAMTWVVNVGGRKTKQIAAAPTCGSWTFQSCRCPTKRRELKVFKKLQYKEKF